MNEDNENIIMQKNECIENEHSWLSIITSTSKSKIQGCRTPRNLKH